MEQLLELDYKQETFLLILKALETAYNEEEVASGKRLSIGILVFPLS